MKQLAIYTSIVGDIDSLMQPQAVDPRYDYICFVRKGMAGEGSEGVWQLREIPADIADSRMLSRYPKLHPDELLPGYSWTLWIDGNICIKDAAFYQRIDDLIAAGVQMAAPLHPSRDCVYDEAYAVVAAGKERYAAALRVIKFLNAKNFPRHAGMWENNILLRCGGDESLKAMHALWWNCLQTLSGRDQLSLVYCARECGVTIVPLLPDGMITRDCDWLLYIYHDRRPRRPWLIKKFYDARRYIEKRLLRRRCDRLSLPGPVAARRHVNGRGPQA